MIRTLRVTPVMLRKWKTSSTFAVKLPKFGPKLFGTTVPSMMARSGSRMAAHAAASSGYAGSRAWSGNGGVQVAGTPINELLCWIPERFALLAIRIRACFFFQAEDGIRDVAVTGVQTCALPISFRREPLNVKSRRTVTVIVRRLFTFNGSLRKAVRECVAAR